MEWEGWKWHSLPLTSFNVGRSWSARREPPTMGKQLVNFITCGCEWSAPFFVIYNQKWENELKVHFVESSFGQKVWSMRRLAIQNSLKCTGCFRIFIHPQNSYFILDTGLILRSIKLFIYIQTCVNVNAYPTRWTVS
jgi:hypothetical protein